MRLGNQPGPEQPCCKQRCATVVYWASINLLSKGPAVVSGMNSPNAIFCPVDVTKSEDVAAALEETKVLLPQMLMAYLSLENAASGKIWEARCCCQLCWDRGGLQSLQFQQG